MGPWAGGCSGASLGPQSLLEGGGKGEDPPHAPLFQPHRLLVGTGSSPAADVVMWRMGWAQGGWLQHLPVWLIRHVER